HAFEKPTQSSCLRPIRTNLARMLPGTKFMNVAATPSRRWLFGAFLVLSVADLYLTWRLFVIEGSAAAERNPVANWVLETYGWAGVACLKLCTIALVVAPCVTICRARPRTGV